MNDAVITVEGVSKKYCRTIKHTMLYGGTDLGKSFLGLNQNSGSLRNGEFWAVDDVSFELKKGETLGIIGPNGSGKSTLLKMLNGIFMPDKGRIEVRGRVGALIEVGAGFHPMLTGRENIYINGAILGLPKEKIDKKFDEIVEFADIGEFIDAPVKHYSSGMFVRLGFSVAIHCEPQILLVDEVLSVGDIKFQKKCSEKIQKMASEIAVIFVSHSIRQIYRLCNRCVFLSNGVIKGIGSVENVVHSYLNESFSISAIEEEVVVLELIENLKLVEAGIYDKNNMKNRTFEYDMSFTVRAIIESKDVFNDIVGIISILSAEGSVVTIMNTEGLPLDALQMGQNKIECFVKNLRLTPGVYSLQLKFKSKYGYPLLDADLGNFEVCDTPGVLLPRAGYYRERADWSCQNFKCIDGK